MILRTFGTIEEAGVLIFAVIILLDNSEVWSGIFQCPVDQDPRAWAAANEATIQATITASGTRLPEMEPRAQAKKFFRDNPAALGLFDLDPTILESTIDTRTANQETLLLKALAYVARVAREEFRPGA